jgi:ABC-2 type transport system ATP-binding protein
MTNAIEVRDLRKTYGTLNAVDGISFDVRQGEFFGILGPNGAGKTTTLEIIEGLQQATSGSVTLLGMAPWPRNSALLPRIGVQLQASAFFEALTAREQLQTFADLYGVAHHRVDEMLDIVGLTESAKVRSEKLSGGQAQRLSIACALVSDPEVVFLDEPTAALDPQARRNLWSLLTSINERGLTVVLTTHYMDEAEVLCDRVAVMDRGKILEIGPPAELVRNLDAPVRIAVTREVLDPEHAATIPGADSVETDSSSTIIVTRTPAPVLSALAESDSLAGLQVRGATLEDVFLELTGREYRA